MIEILAGLIFVLAYAGITFEHSLHLNKAALALVAGAALWIIVGLGHGGTEVATELAHAGSEIFGIVIFLIAAMSLVEILVHYEFFDVIRGKLLRHGFGNRTQFIIIGVLTFFLSAVLDNLTTTIVMIQISRRFFQGDNMLRAAAMVVVAANAGGAFSPIGDVTTIMLWLAGKFDTLTIIAKGFLPSFALFIVSMYFLSRHISRAHEERKDEVLTTLGRSEKLVVALVFISFTLPLAMGIAGLPPYLGLLLGLGCVWVVVDLMKKYRPKPTHLNAAIDELIKKVDIPSIKFFVGILLAVSALGALGILDHLAGFLFGPDPTDMRLAVGSVALGFISAVLDNVPLTAIAIEMLQTTNQSLWVLLAIAVGTGGSLLVVGSAAGVVAMGMVKELTFGRYLKIATLPALAGYVAAVAVWSVQYFVFGW